MAKSILDTLTKHEKFTLTLATIDTHFPHGFYNENCPIKPNENSDEAILQAVLACSDKYLIEFLDFVEKSPYGANTEIVLVGDHLFMGRVLVENIPRKKRKAIGVFANSNIKENFYGRDFTSFDMFPTILESMCFAIEGNKLGFGVSLKSGQKTLLEQFGADSLGKELKRLSKSFEYQSIL